LKQICTILSVLCASLSLAFGADKPRAVSLDYCSDQYLLKLADPAQILAVSRGATGDYSYMRKSAAAYARIRASTEEALTLAPDLVLRQWGGGANAERAFARFGAKVVTLGFASNFDDIRNNIRQTAQALEQQQRGAALIAELDAALNALARRTPPNTKTLYVTPGGVTAGAGTMIDAILTAAGVQNLAADQSYWPALPAETLIQNPPELIVGGFFVSRDQDINHWSAARHPALAALFQNTPTVQLPPDLVGCAAWYSIDAAVIIANEARRSANE